jgi:hypothetical protein
MTALDDGGWLYLTNASGIYNIKCRCKKVTPDESDKIISIDYPADGHLGLSFLIIKRQIKVEGIFFDSTTDYDLFKTNLIALQTAGVFDLKVQRNSDGSFRTWNGVNITMPVLYKSIRGDDKVYGGDSEIWVIKQLTFIQSGILVDVNS